MKLQIAEIMCALHILMFFHLSHAWLAFLAGTCIFHLNFRFQVKQNDAIFHMNCNIHCTSWTMKQATQMPQRVDDIQTPVQTNNNKQSNEQKRRNERELRNNVNWVENLHIYSSFHSKYVWFSYFNNF